MYLRAVNVCFIVPEANAGRSRRKNALNTEVLGDFYEVINATRVAPSLVAGGITSRRLALSKANKKQLSVRKIDKPSNIVLHCS